MMNNHFVLDTNIIISALLMPKSITRQAFEQALRTGKILQSTATIAEYLLVLNPFGNIPIITVPVFLSKI